MRSEKLIRLEVAMDRLENALAYVDLAHRDVYDYGVNMGMVQDQLKFDINVIRKMIINERIETNTPYTQRDEKEISK